MVLTNAEHIKAGLVGELTGLSGGRLPLGR
jgi:hypothetical protein